MKKTLALLIITAVLAGLFSSCSGIPGDDEKEIFNPAEINTIIEPDFLGYTPSRYLYSMLSETGRQAYRKIYNCVFEHPDKILIPFLEEEELSRVFLALKYDNPHILCLEDSYTYYTTETGFYILPHYSCKKDKCEKRTEELLGAARELCSPVSAQADQYQKELFLHDAFLKGIKYSEGSDSANAYGSLVNGRAMCGGYTLGLKLLFDMTGLKSMPVAGNVVSDGETVKHMWLAVSVNGEWYFTDPTWDDPVSDGGRQNTRHAYFNVSADEINANHSDYVLPDEITCVSGTAGYYAQSGLCCENEDWSSFVKDSLAGVTVPGSTEIKFTVPETYNEAKRALFDEGGLSGIAAEVFGVSGADFRISHIAEDDVHVLQIFFENGKDD